MKPQLQLLLLWVAAIGLTGCSSSQISRIDQNRSLYETFPLEIRQAVLDGRVEPGMKPEMVEMAWGKPTEIVTTPVGDEIWIYQTGGSDGTVLYPGGGVYGGGTGTTGIGISTPGGSIGTGGIGIGGTGVGGAPIVMPGSPPDIKEVIFRKGVVHRADAPK